MLDVGFSEILLTSAIALIVLGPEKLPKVARQVGNWMGRARAMARQLTEQLEREVSADELMKQTQANAARPPLSSVSIDPVPLDTPYQSSHIAAAPPSSVAPSEALAPSPAVAPPASSPGTYSSAANAAPHGADWHPDPNPPESNQGNG
jgi:sec-independent protein translocase protein TatB